MKNLIILLSIIFYSGCSKSFIIESKVVKSEELSCEMEAKPKSLQLLEQQYRCTSD